LDGLRLRLLRAAHPYEHPSHHGILCHLLIKQRFLLRRFLQRHLRGQRLHVSGTLSGKIVLRGFGAELTGKRNILLRGTWVSAWRTGGNQSWPHRAQAF
tara:strand:+ start:148 stop:444 length:297 start_codon:yes stop_codon:yes gene_type:complete